MALQVRLKRNNVDGSGATCEENAAGDQAIYESNPWIGIHKGHIQHSRLCTPSIANHTTDITSTVYALHYCQNYIYSTTSF